MTYKIGTRVKKVRGEHGMIGITGVVTNVAVSSFNRMIGCDMTVKIDAAGFAMSGAFVRRGTIVGTKASSWEPITPDGHRAGVKGECSLLDELLSRENNNETVK